MEKLTKIIVNILPIILMLLLIPIVINDYFLTLIYIIIITYQYEKKDLLFLAIGFVAMFVAMLIGEYFFIKTGVETFNRNSLFNLMPLWLPFLWAYVFVIIKRVISILK